MSLKKRKILVEQKQSKNDPSVRIDTANTERQLDLVISELVDAKHQLLAGNSFDATQYHLIRHYKKELKRLKKQEESFFTKRARRLPKRLLETGLAKGNIPEQVLTLNKIVELENIIKTLEEREKALGTHFIKRNPKENREELRIKMEYLDGLLQKAEKSRSRFKKQKGVFKGLYSVSTIFSIISAGAVVATSFFGLNLVAEPIRVISDYMKYSSLTLAHTFDPNITEHDKKEVRDQLKAINNFRLGELVLDVLAVGGLGLAFAFPFVLPVSVALLCAGNIVSIRVAQEELKREQMFGAEPGKALRETALRARIASKKANTVASAILVVASMALLLTAIFPPAGFALWIIAGTASLTAGLCSAYAAVKTHQELNAFGYAEALTRVEVDKELQSGKKLADINALLHAKEQAGQFVPRLDKVAELAESLPRASNENMEALKENITAPAEEAPKSQEPSKPGRSPPRERPKP